MLMSDSSSLPIASPSPWRLIQKENFVNVADLADFLQLSADQKESLLSLPKFPLSLPRRLAEKMEKGSISDPLFLQFVPLKKELDRAMGFIADPVCDVSFQKSGKLLQKYEGRVLLVTTGACAMHCRYCFRQNFDYEVARKGFAEELEFIRADESIAEVILSGGDPLSLSDRILADLFEGLNQIEHVKRIRFHTRFPIGIPERINDQFLSILSGVKKQVWFLLHSNHPAELDSDVLGAMKRIQRLGIPVLNQSVLLAGVNDSFEVLKELCLRLVDHGIQPYYLHQLDQVEGASHFLVDVDQGKGIMNRLRESMSGYGVPIFVKEVAGRLSKTPL
jgi:EF-P beta-lysylation protein EpmB